MKKFRKVIKNQLKRKAKFILAPLKAGFKSKYSKKITKYASIHYNSRVLDDTILYQSRDGKSITDSPYAMFLQLINDKKYKEFTHIWVASDYNKKKEFKKQLKKYRKIIVVVKESDEYLEALCTSRYLINNSTFPAYFSKKDEQIYINTWHGTPLKHMGLDVPDNLVGSQNVIKNFLSSNYIISPNAHTTRILNNAFRLSNIYGGKILEIGYPRIDLTINNNKNHIKSLLKKHKVKIGNDKVILYAPTWRGTDVNNSIDNIEEVLKTVKLIEKNTNYQVLLKVHPFDYKKASKVKNLNPYLVPDDFDTNELLTVVDLLVTDYSSIFFDYLVTNNPIIFYSPDYDEYNSSRGFYITPDELPGPSVKSVDDLIEEINKAEDTRGKYKQIYKEFKSDYVPYEDGDVAKTAINQIFNNTFSIEKNNKKETILIYPGGMKNNGITTSAINLLENIDYNKYDVTIFLNNSKNKEILNNLAKVNENVRIILRKGPLLSSIKEYYKHLFIKNRGLLSFVEKNIYPKELYAREFKKIFGISRFDYVIDFSGYSMFWPKILLSTESKKKLIYMHSDIKSDMNRWVNGKRPHYLNLKGVITLYNSFDYLVSVSDETKNVNQKNLPNTIVQSKFTSAMNTLNLENINENKNKNNDFFTTSNKDNVLVSVINNEITTIPFNESDFKIISMGRLSPEKGFDVLISAFKLIVNEKDNVKLYILGDGPLRDQLIKLIYELELEDSVFLVGQKSNPFNIMSKCDLFTLTSHYEGQSMVLLESLTLKLDVLASDIPANRYVLKDGEYGMLVDNTPEKVAEGINKFIDKSVPEYKKFDPEKHNKKAMSEFYNLL